MKIDIEFENSSRKQGYEAISIEIVGCSQKVHEIVELIYERAKNWKGWIEK